MSAPGYSDLGGKARSVFGTGYYYNQTRLKITGPVKDFSLETNLMYDMKTSQFTSALLGKHFSESYGNVSLKVQNAGPVIGELKKTNVVDNVDVNAGIMYDTVDNSSTGKLSATYHVPQMNVCGSITKDQSKSGIDLLTSSVVKLGSIIFGYQLGLNSDDGRVTNHNLAAGFDNEDYNVLFRWVQIPKELCLSAFFKASDTVDLAVDAKMAKNDEMQLFFVGVGACCKLDNDCKLRLKFDKNLQFGTSLQFKIHDEASLTMAFNIDTTNLSAGQHKIGLGIDIGS